MTYSNLLLIASVLACTSALAQAPDVLGVNAALGIGQVESSPEIPTPSPVENKAIIPAATTTSSADSTAVFGDNLFTGEFARNGSTQFNPDYYVSTGDKIQLRLWGGFVFDSVMDVDPKGNIFIPNVGPVKIVGVRNQDLQRVVEAAIRKVYRANVHSYASLAAAQPVRVFVSGYVRRPGLYDGTSMDSILHYLDSAGGIDPGLGSFLHIEVKRGGEVRATANLYDFLLTGHLPLVQLADGDVIFVAPRKQTVKASGLVGNPKQFEFADSDFTVAELIKLAKPKPEATHVRVIRNTGAVKNVDYFSMSNAGMVQLNNGDEIEFTADKKIGTITVRVEGEHLSPQEYVLSYGSRLGALLENIEYSERSDVQAVQLYRRSVKERHKRMLLASLRSLETSALTARSGTTDEARLRKEEAELILQWVERAKKIEPSGQVVIAQAKTRDDLLLENGDIVNIPAKDGLVLVSGEVLFPNAIAYDDDLTLDDVIQRAGGYTQNADNSRIIVAHRDGSYSDGEYYASSTWWDETENQRGHVIKPGDEVLVLPKIDVKSRQIAKDLTQILYQIAISAKVVLGL